MGKHGGAAFSTMRLLALVTLVAVAGGSDDAYDVLGVAPRGKDHAAY